MHIHGTVRLDKKTKNLAKRIRQGEIALIDHQDLDTTSAEMLRDCGVAAVVNASKSISGKYANAGPRILLDSRISILDDVGQEAFNVVKEGEKVEIRGNYIYKNGIVIAQGELLTSDKVNELLEAARENLSRELLKFVENTLTFVEREKADLLSSHQYPELRTNFNGRHALIVVRGPGFKEDLQIVRGYIRDIRPVLIGVDGGADALLEMGFKPNIILGDMDSVSDDALRCGAELIVHAYAKDSKAPGLERVANLGLEAKVIPQTGTSEDLALLLAYEKGAELIVAVGAHSCLEDFLDKGRGGMSSTFLVRLKVGSRLVDAKGVSRLYRIKPRKQEIIMLVAAFALLFLVVLSVSPTAKDLLDSLLNNIRVLLLKLRFWL